MKQPKAYRVYNGVMESQLVTNMEFNDKSIKFSVRSYAFEQALDGSWHIPIGHTASLDGFVTHPYRIFESEAEAWAFEIENLYAKKDKLHKEIDAIVYLIDRAVQNLAQVKASQNETKPPE